MMAKPHVAPNAQMRSNRAKSSVEKITLLMDKVASLPCPQCGHVTLIVEWTDERYPPRLSCTRIFCSFR